MSNRYYLIQLIFPEAQVSTATPLTYLYDLYPVEQQLEALFGALDKILEKIQTQGTEDDQALGAYLDVCELFKLVYQFNRMTPDNAGLSHDYWMGPVNWWSNAWDGYEKLFAADFKAIAHDDYGQSMIDSSMYVFVISVAKMFFFLKQGRDTFDGYRLQTHITAFPGAYDTYKVNRVLHDFNEIYAALLRGEQSWVRTYLHF